jgi:hypothetical protein
MKQAEGRAASLAELRDAARDISHLLLSVGHVVGRGLAVQRALRKCISPPSWKIRAPAWFHVCGGACKLECTNACGSSSLPLTS